jgi:hypothetical protein
MSCKNINNDILYQKININNIKKQIKKIVDNPKVLIDRIQLPNKKYINIIQDGVLLAGTKQRVVKLFLKQMLKKNPNIKILLYAGSYNGFGGIATAYGAYKLGLKCEIYLSKEGTTYEKILQSKQIHTLKALNANIFICDTYREARDLEYNKSTIEIEKNKWETLPQYYIVPMGINDKDRIMINILSKQLKKSCKNTILTNHKNLRIWLVSGSGGIAMSIAKAFPNAKLLLLLTGGGKYKKIVYEWAKNEKNITIIHNETILDDKNERSDRHLYYSSVADYDDLIWPYVKKYALENDFIWNVASDRFIE